MIKDRNSLPRERPLASHPPALPDIALIRLPLVLEITALSKTTIYAMVTRGEFPAPVQCGKRSARWRLSEVSNWVQARQTGTVGVGAASRDRSRCKS